MGIVLGTLLLDARHTVVRETYEEIGGRDGRRVELTGMVVGENSVEATEARLDAIMREASRSGYETELIVRPGRRALVRRVKFAREVCPDNALGRFALTLEARDPWDESAALTRIAWDIDHSGAFLSLAQQGNVAAPLTLSAYANGDLIAPAFSDGINTLQYNGMIAGGQQFQIDGLARRWLVDAHDVTPYVTGDWPMAYPGGNALTYTADPASAHLIQATVSYRARWW